MTKGIHDNWIAYLPSEHAVGWDSLGMIEYQTYPGACYEKLSSGADGRWNWHEIQIFGDRRKISDDSSVDAASLPSSRWKIGDKVALDYAMSDETCPPIQYIRSDDYTCYIHVFEEAFQNIGLYFDREYEIEKVEPASVIHLKGVKLPFYWKFFKKV